MHNMKKYLHTLKSGFPQIKEVTHNCSSLKLCFQEWTRFLDISVWDPRKIIRVSWNSILDPGKSKLKPQNLILYSRKLWGLRIKFLVETVKLPLSSTVLYRYKHSGKKEDKQESTLEAALKCNWMAMIGQWYIIKMLTLNGWFCWTDRTSSENQSRTLNGICSADFQTLFSKFYS